MRTAAFRRSRSTSRTDTARIHALEREQAGGCVGALLGQRDVRGLGPPDIRPAVDLDHHVGIAVHVIGNVGELGFLAGSRDRVAGVEVEDDRFVHVVAAEPFERFVEDRRRPRRAWKAYSELPTTAPDRIPKPQNSDP